MSPNNKHTYIATIYIQLIIQLVDTNAGSVETEQADGLVQD